MFSSTWKYMFHFILSIIFLIEHASCLQKCNSIKTPLGFVCVCNSSSCDDLLSIPKGSQVHHVFTGKDFPGFNRKILDANASPLENGMQFIANFSDIKTSDLLGFGGSLTDSFGYNLRLLSEQTQTQLLRSYFGAGGVNYTLCRMPMGSSDFSPHYYDHDQVENDITLEHFQLRNEDYEYKISLMQQINDQSKNHVKLIASNWSPPPWMKKNNAIDPAYLKEDYYQLYADYQTRFLEEYRKAGIEFWGMTPVNEPLTGITIHFTINNLIMFPEQQRKWLADNLIPTLNSHNFSHIKIYALDDQRKYINWWADILFEDELVASNIAGMGIHWYFDNFTSPLILDEFHRKYPTKQILYTESSINMLFGTLTDKEFFHGSGSWNRGALYGKSIIEALNHFSSGWIDWNMGLDSKGGPNYLGLYCDAPIIINAERDEFYKQPMFYAIGHFSAFTQPGAKVVTVSKYIIESGGKVKRETPEFPLPTGDEPLLEAAIYTTAVANPNGMNVIFILNGYESQKNIEIKVVGLGTSTEDRIIEASVYGNSLNSFIFWTSAIDQQ